MTWIQWMLAVAVIGVCLLLTLVVLVQRGRGAGLTGAFGGAGGGGAFGAKTGDVLTWITVVVASVFLFLSVVSNYAFDQSPGPQPPTTVQTDTTVPLPQEQPFPEGLPPGSPESFTPEDDELIPLLRVPPPEDLEGQQEEDEPEPDAESDADRSPPAPSDEPPPQDRSDE